jgi:hypothetical protein
MAREIGILNTRKVETLDTPGRHADGGNLMTKAVMEFLENWIPQNVTATSKYGGAIMALTLADKCREAAEGLGIDLDSQVFELEELIYARMKTPNTAELLDVWATMRTKVRPLHPSFNP